MNIENHLRSAFERELGEGGNGTTRSQFEAFDKVRKERLSKTVDRGRADAAVGAARYGAAAYIVGIHLSLNDDLDEASQWLRDAAELDVGDAAFRLAQIYESQAVDEFNLRIALGEGTGKDDEKFSEAYYWYSRAASAGYAQAGYPGANGLDLPPISFECCDGMRGLKAEEEGRMALRAGQEAGHRAFLVAQAEAEKMLREAREDVNFHLTGVRREVRELSLEYQRLSEKIAEQQKVAKILSQLSATPPLALPRLATLLVRGWFNPEVKVNLAKVGAIYGAVAKVEPWSFAKWCGMLRPSWLGVLASLATVWRFMFGWISLERERPGAERIHGAEPILQEMWPERDEVPEEMEECRAKGRLGKHRNDRPRSVTGDGFRPIRKTPRSSQELVNS